MVMAPGPALTISTRPSNVVVPLTTKLSVPVSLAERMCRPPVVIVGPVRKSASEP